MVRAYDPRQITVATFAAHLPAGLRREVDDELEFHLEERVRDYLARGVEPQTARRAALERLGDPRDRAAFRRSEIRPGSGSC